jgi:hypothetical protein
MFRTIKRWFSTEEVKQLGTELERLVDTFSDLGHKLEGLQLKHDRLTNKFRMQDARQQRRNGRETGLSEEEQAIVDDLRRGEAEVVSTRDPF